MQHVYYSKHTCSGVDLGFRSGGLLKISKEEVVLNDVSRPRGKFELLSWLALSLLNPPLIHVTQYKLSNIHGNCARYQVECVQLVYYRIYSITYDINVDTTTNRSISLVSDGSMCARGLGFNSLSG